MEKLSRKIVDFIYNNSRTADRDMADVYQYGIEITLSSAVNFMIIIVCSMIFGDIAAGFVFLCCFIPLRSYTGGYHAETYLRCNAAFACTYIIVFALSSLMCFVQPSVFTAAIILAAALIPVVRFAPVENKYKKLTDDKQKRSRILSIIIYLLLTAAALLLRAFDIRYGYLIMLTLLSVSLLIIAELAMQKMNIHKSE